MGHTTASHTQTLLRSIDRYFLFLLISIFSLLVPVQVLEQGSGLSDVIVFHWPRGTHATPGAEGEMSSGSLGHA